MSDAAMVKRAGAASGQQTPLRIPPRHDAAGNSMNIRSPTVINQRAVRNVRADVVPIRGSRRELLTVI
jgi:hypothetical protein